MGTALTGNTVSSTYNALLKTTGDTAIDGTLRAIGDGLGNDTPLQLSTARVNVAGPLDCTQGNRKADSWAANPTTLAYAATTTIDFSNAAATVQTVTLTGNVTFATSNLTAGAAKKIRVVASGGPWTIAIPGWLNLNGSVPATIASGKTGILSLFSWSTTDAAVEASFAVTP